VRDNGLFDGIPEKRGRTDTREWLEQKIPNWTIEGLQLLSSISVNLDQFLFSYSQARDLLKGHDAAVLRLIDRVSEYHEAIRSSAELKAVYDEATQPEMVRKMIEAYPHAFPGDQPAEQKLQSALGPDEERLSTLSEAIVNERSEVILGSGWRPAPFWNLHREALIGVARGEKFLDYRRKKELAWTELASIIESAADCLKGIRHQLHLKIFAEGNSIFNGFPRLYPSRSGGDRASIKLLLHRHIPWNRTVVTINHRDLIIPPDYALCHNHMPSSVVDQIDANDNRLVLSPFCFGHTDLQLKLLEVRRNQMRRRVTARTQII